MAANENRIKLAPDTLFEPAPCDECRHRPRCARTGEACSAYRAYHAGEDWSLQPTQPRVDVGQRLGFIAGRRRA